MKAARRAPGDVRGISLVLMIVGGFVVWLGLTLLPAWYASAWRWNPWITVSVGAAWIVIGWALRRGYRLARGGCLVIWAISGLHLLVLAAIRVPSLEALGIRGALGLLLFLALPGLLLRKLYTSKAQAFFADGPMRKASASESATDEAVDSNS